MMIKSLMIFFKIKLKFRIISIIMMSILLNANKFYEIFASAFVVFFFVHRFRINDYKFFKWIRLEFIIEIVECV